MNSRVAAALTALLLAPSVRAVETSVEQARALFAAGAQAYDKGQYPEAIEAFEAAYRVSQRPGIVFSIAQAHRRQYYVDGKREHLDAAILHYHEYLNQVREAGRRSDATEALAELELVAARASGEGSATAEATEAPKKAAETRVIVTTQVTTARITVDGSAPHESPFVSTVTPGHHRVVVTAPGYGTVERDVVAVEGEMLGFDVALRDLPARLRVAGAPGIDVAVDGRPIGATPFGAPAEVPPGRHIVTVTAGGHRPREIEITLERGGSRVLPVQLETTGQRIASYVLFGAGAAGVLTGGTFVVLSLVEEHRAQSISDAAKVRNISAAELADYADASRSRDALRRDAAIGFGAGAGAAIAGALLFVFDHPLPDRTLDVEHGAPSPRRVDVSAAPLLGPGLRGAALRGTF